MHQCFHVIVFCIHRVLIFSTNASFIVFVENNPDPRPGSYPQPIWRTAQPAICLLARYTPKKNCQALCKVSYSERSSFFQCLLASFGDNQWDFFSLFGFLGWPGIEHSWAHFADLRNDQQEQSNSENFLPNLVWFWHSSCSIRSVWVPLHLERAVGEYFRENHLSGMSTITSNFCTS